MLYYNGQTFLQEGLGTRLIQEMETETILAIFLLLANISKNGMMNTEQLRHSYDFFGDIKPHDYQLMSLYKQHWCIYNHYLNTMFLIPLLYNDVA